MNWTPVIIIVLAAMGVALTLVAYFDQSSTFVSREADYPNEWQKP